MTTQNFVTGFDATGAGGSMSATDINNLVNAAKVASDRGLVLRTTDTGATPDVPDAVTNTDWQRYVWIRIRTTPALPILYVWSPVSSNDAIYKKWIPLTAFQTLSPANFVAGVIPAGSYYANSIEGADIHLSALCGDGLTSASNKLKINPSTEFVFSGGVMNLATGGVATSKIADGAITNDKIADYKIKEAKLCYGAETYVAGGSTKIAMSGDTTIDITNVMSVEISLVASGILTLKGGRAGQTVTLVIQQISGSAAITAWAAYNANDFLYWRGGTKPTTTATIYHFDIVGIFVGFVTASPASNIYLCSSVQNFY